MLADCELSSSYSSASSERARLYRHFSEPSLYDRLHLENVRITTTAERKKPVLITRSKTMAIVNSQSRCRRVEPRLNDKTLKSRYEARRRFFEDLEHRETLGATETTIASPRSRATSNGEDITEQNSTTKPNEESRSASVKARVKAHHPTVCVTSNVKSQIAYLNGESKVTMQPVEWRSIARPGSVEVINVRETESTSCRNGLEIPYTNGHGRIEEIETRNGEGTEHRAIEEAVEEEETRTIRENDERPHDNPLDSTIDASKALQLYTAIKMSRRDSEDSSSQPLSDLSSDDRDERSPGDRREHDDGEEGIADTRASKNEETNDNLAANLEPTAERNVRSWIENSARGDGGDFSSRNAQADNDTYESFCNDITKILESIDMNVSTSRTELDALPDTDTCVKYNLDSTNMSLIYSLTPSAVVEQEEESANDDTSRDLAERSSDWRSDSMTGSDNDDAFGDYIWIEPTGSKELNDDEEEEEEGSSRCSRERATPSDGGSCCELLHDLENSFASSGSDILELPARTVLELKDIDGEVFQNGINESANEIIADLNATDDEALQVARRVVFEIVECVYALSYLDSSIYDLGVVREIVRHLIDSYRYEYSLLTGSSTTDRRCASEINSTSASTTVANSDSDNVCQIKDFLGNLSPDNFQRDNDRDPSSAVIEFCTVAKRRLPIVAIDDGTLELNFRVVKVTTNERDADTSPSARSVFRGAKRSRKDNDRDTVIRYTVDAKSNAKETATRSEDEVWPCDRCAYCREEEESAKEYHCLTPIKEELEDSPPPETVDCASKELDEGESRRPDTDLVDVVEGCTADSAGRAMSLDDTYTISEASDEDNDEMNGPRERSDVWDSSVDCMSYSYDTKEFIHLERAIADDSRANVA